MADDGKHPNLSTYQVGGECWQTINMILAPSMFDCNVLPLDIARFFQVLAKAATSCGLGVRTAMQEAYRRHR